MMPHVLRHLSYRNSRCLWRQESEVRDALCWPKSTSALASRVITPLKHYTFSLLRPWLASVAAGGARSRR
jgi:hypothetical protein